ncbi:hypothetical protein KFE25_001908 [Diacronema lutheri]|uniref:Phytanoyl-CoA dioxygenase n=2 Tax=Diacronema lutheri TaxID=2081491 RepID=A0A8J5XKN8_DIALT|nr:hypothetical protein KFE25_001908 [Diacronema lutheri]
MSLLHVGIAAAVPATDSRFLVGGHGGVAMSFDLEHDAPRLEPGSAEARAHLAEHGYAVLASVLNETELRTARELLWRFMEGTRKGIRRADPRTWHRIGPNQFGIVWNSGAGQSELMWHVRSAPRLLEFFSSFWGVGRAELLTSFEGFGVMPPTELESSWGALAEGWFHTDQNGASRPGLWTVQSFTSLHDQDETTGAFVVVPGSHLEHAAVTRRALRAAPGTPRTQQFLLVPPDDSILTARRPRLIRCRAGDAVVWDSRTVHCNTPPLTREVPWRPTVERQSGMARGSFGPDGSALPSPPLEPHPPNFPDFLRVVAYVSMAPRARATPAVLLARRRAVLNAQACTHWPFEATCVPPDDELPPPPDLGELQLDLAGLSAEDGALIAAARRAATA